MQSMQDMIKANIQKRMNSLKYKAAVGKNMFAKNFPDVGHAENICEGNAVASNGVFTAFPKKVGNSGVIAVVKSYEFQKIENDLPMITGHKAKIADLSFSPYSNNLLASASDDGTIKFWVIPDDGITQNTTQADLELAHGKKVSCFDWHPCVDFNIASCGQDNMVRIWDIQSQQEVLSTQLGGQPTSLKYNSNGSMLAALNKSKTVQIFDPRQQGSVQTANAHESIKSPKLIWLGDTDNLMTMGQDGSNDKEVKFWDIRNFGQPIAHQMISGSAGLPFLHYDRELQLVYCAHKGDNSITCYGYTPQDKNHLSVGATYKDKNIVKAFNILPKTTVNCQKNEVTRTCLVTNKDLQYISFYIIQRTTAEQSLYPDCFHGESSNDNASWLAGKNTEPVFKKHDLQEDEINQQKQQKKSDFLNKLSKGSTVVVPQQQQQTTQKEVVVQEVQSNFAEEEQLKQNIEAEKNKVQDLQNQHDAQQDQIEQLKQQLYQLQQQKQQVDEEVQSLQANVEEQRNVSANNQQQIQELEAQKDNMPSNSQSNDLLDFGDSQQTTSQKQPGDHENLVGQHIKLTYFDIYGRAEPIRLMLWHKGIQFEDERIDQAQFAALKEQGELLFKSLPQVQIGDLKLGQSRSILRTLGKMYGYYPSENAKTTYIAERFIDSVQDVLDAFGAIYFNPTIPEEEKGPKIQELMQGAFMKLLYSLDDQLSTHNAPYIAGTDSPTTVDFIVTALIFTGLRNPQSQMYDENDMFLSQVPGLQTYANSRQAEFQAYFDTRGPRPM